MTEPNGEDRTPSVLRGRSGWPRSRALAIGGAVALVVLALTTAAYVLLVVVPARTVETGKEVGHGAVEVAAEGARTAMELGSELAARIKDELGLRPRVVVDSRVVAEQSKEILELATVEREYRVEYAFAHTWLGSTKEIQLTGRYRAKAGFDLEDGFVLDLETGSLEPRGESPRDERAGDAESAPTISAPWRPSRDASPTSPRIHVRLPEPELLSLELLGIQVDEEEGIWNRISDADRERALANLRGTAHRDILRTGILDQARESMANRIQRSFLDHFAPTDFEFGALAPPEIPPPG